MTPKEEAYSLLDTLSEDDLRTVARILRGLAADREPRPVPDLSPEERRRRVYAFAGSLAHLPGGVDEFLARKREDKAREDVRDRRRQAGVA